MEARARGGTGRGGRAISFICDILYQPNIHNKHCYEFHQDIHRVTLLCLYLKGCNSKNIKVNI